MTLFIDLSQAAIITSVTQLWTSAFNSPSLSPLTSDLSATENVVLSFSLLSPCHADRLFTTLEVPESPT